MLDNGIDLSPQFYRSVNELSFFSNYSEPTINIQKIVSKLITLPTYSGISQNYIERVAEIINKY